MSIMALNRTCLLLLAFVLPMSGCTSPGQTPSIGSDLATPVHTEDEVKEDDASRPEANTSATPPSHENETDGEMQEPEPKQPTVVRVYDWHGVQVGMDPDQVVEHLPLVDEPWMIREETFQAPNGTVRLAIGANFRLGAWSGGIEIVHESGLMVYRHEYFVNADDGGWGGCFFSHHCTEAHLGGGVWRHDGAPPGNYTVAYEFVGAAEGYVVVDAVIAS